MLKLFITLQVAVLAVIAGMEDRIVKHRDERGSVTIEQVIWAGAVIVIVGIVVAAIKALRDQRVREDQVGPDDRQLSRRAATSAAR